MAIKYRAMPKRGGLDSRMLIGVHDGVAFYMPHPVWSCGWYWSFGHLVSPHWDMHVRTVLHDLWQYGNLGPEAPRGTVPARNQDAAFRDFFDATPLSEEEMYAFVDAMSSFYRAADFAEMLHLHGCNLSSDPPARDVLTDDALWRRVNAEIIPGIMERASGLLLPEPAALSYRVPDGEDG